jgi:hypothetical protein
VALVLSALIWIIATAGGRQIFIKEVLGDAFDSQAEPFERGAAVAFALQGLGTYRFTRSPSVIPSIFIPFDFLPARLPAQGWSSFGPHLSCHNRSGACFDYG